MMLVTGVLTIFVCLFLKLLILINKKEHADLVAPFYFIFHAIGAVCTYKEWTPASFKVYPKDVLQFQILINFVLITAIPLIRFKITIFVMFPALMVASYLQLQEETKIMKEMYLSFSDQ